MSSIFFPSGTISAEDMARAYASAIPNGVCALNDLYLNHTSGVYVLSPGAVWCDGHYVELAENTPVSFDWTDYEIQPFSNTVYVYIDTTRGIAEIRADKNYTAYPPAGIYMLRLWRVDHDGAEPEDYRLFSAPISKSFSGTYLEESANLQMTKTISITVTKSGSICYLQSNVKQLTSIIPNATPEGQQPTPISGIQLPYAMRPAVEHRIYVPCNNGASHNFLVINADGTIGLFFGTGNTGSRVTDSGQICGFWEVAHV